jgi:hypothetical protein
LISGIAGWVRRAAEKGLDLEEKFERRTSGAKAHVDLSAFAAVGDESPTSQSSPDTKPLGISAKMEFFRSLQDPKTGAKRTKRRSNRSGVSGFYTGHWPPRILWPAEFPPHLLQIFPAGLPLFRAASLAVALAGHLLVLGCPFLRGSRHITGACLIAIGWPFATVISFNQLPEIYDQNCLDSGRKKDE